MRAVAQFNVALEHVAEAAVVVAVGALLAWVQWDWCMAWFVPVLFLLVRPLAVFAGLAGAPVAHRHRHGLTKSHFSEKYLLGEAKGIAMCFDHIFNVCRIAAAHHDGHRYVCRPRLLQDIFIARFATLSRQRQLAQCIGCQHIDRRLVKNHVWRKPGNQAWQGF